MSNPIDPRNLHDEVAALAALYLDDELSPVDFKRLSALLQSTPEAAALFNDHCLHARSLRQTMSGRAVIEIELPQTEAATPPKPDGEAHSGGRTVGISAPSPQSTIGNRKSKISPRHTPFIIYPIALAAAVLFTACGVAIYLLAFNAPTPPQPKPAQPGHPVATLIEISGGGDLRTPHGYPAEGDDFSAGEYTLSGGGTAEFMLTNAVNVKLRGDTRMVMRNNMNVALTRGSAEFVCPKDAQGFTVHLPGETKIVDLGTRFHVSVDPAGRSVVAVTKGSVRVDESDAVSHLLNVGDRMVLADDQPARIARIAVHPGETVLADYDLGVSRSPVFGSAPRLSDAPDLKTHSDAHGVTLDQPGQYLTLAANPLHDFDGDWAIRIVLTPRDIANRSAIAVHSGDPRSSGVGLIVVDRQWHLLIAGRKYYPLAPVEFDQRVTMSIVHRDGFVRVYRDGQTIGQPVDADSVTPSSDGFLVGGTIHRADESLFATIESLRISEIDDTFDPRTPNPNPKPSSAPVTAEPE